MWSSRLFWKVFAACVGVIIFSAALFGLLIAERQSQALRAQLTERIRVSAVMLSRVVQADLLAARQAELQAVVRNLGQLTETRLTVIALDGRVLADSALGSLEDVLSLENHANRPEIRDALHHGFGQLQRFSATRQANYVYYARRIDINGRPSAIARAAVPLSVVQSHIAQSNRLLWLFAAIVTATGAIGTYYILARLIAPLASLTDAVQRMTRGQFDQRLDVTKRDEIGALAEAFNQMSDELSARIAELRARGDQLAAVLAGMIEGVVAVSSDGRILFANESAGTMLDFDIVRSRGKSLLSAIRDDTLQRSMHQAIKDGEVVHSETRSLGANAQILAVHAAPLPGEPCPGVVLVLYDMTNLRKLETLRHEFVANVSHELKTPLSAIKAYAETLREGALYDQTHNLLFVQRIEDQADRLHQLIMDLLSLARVESGKETFELAQVNLKKAVDKSLTGHMPTAKAKSIELYAEPVPAGLSVYMDEEALQQILDNLIDNAVKYTTAEGVVRVCCSVDNNHILLEVSDTGIGIASEDQRRLFERFFRVDKARSRELGGTGLGLSIVKHLAQFFGGSVSVQSEVGKGSIFRVRLPKRPHTK